MLTRQTKVMLLLSIWLVPAVSFAETEQQSVRPHTVQQEAVPSEIIQSEPAPEPKPEVKPEPDRSTNITIPELNITGHIENRELALTLDFEAETKAPDRRMLLAQGDIVLVQADQAQTVHKLDYVRKERAYYVSWPRRGRYPLNMSFIARSRTDVNSQWREVKLQIPAGRVQKI